MINIFIPKEKSKRIAVRSGSRKDRNLGGEAKTYMCSI